MATFMKPQSDHFIDFMCMGFNNFVLLFIQASHTCMIYVSWKCLTFLYKIYIVNVSLYIMLLWNFCNKAWNIETSS